MNEATDERTPSDAANAGEQAAPVQRLVRGSLVDLFGDDAARTNRKPSQQSQELNPRVVSLRDELFAIFSQ